MNTGAKDSPRQCWGLKIYKCFSPGLLFFVLKIKFQACSNILSPGTDNETPKKLPSDKMYVGGSTNECRLLYTRAQWLNN